MNIATTAVLLAWASLSPAVPVPTLRYEFNSAGTQADTGIAPAAPALLTGAEIVPESPAGFSAGSLDLTLNGANNIYAGPSGGVSKINAPSQMTVTFWLNLRGDPNARDCVASDLARWIAYEGTGGWDIRIEQLGGPPTASNFRLTFGQQQGHTTHENKQGLYSGVLDADRKWVFVAVSYDASRTVRFYSGTEAAAVGASGTPAIFSYPIWPNTEPVRIGGDTGFPSLDYTPPAWIDDFRFYSQALTLSELEQVRLANVPEPAAILLLALGGLAVMRRRRGNHVVGRPNHIGRRNMQTQAVSLMVVFSIATGGYAASFSRFTIALGGDNHAAEWKQGQRMLFTPGTTEDGRVFHVGDVITWDVRLECGGIHEQPGHPADGYPVWGAANIVHCLEIRDDSATGPLATSAGFFSSINDGTGGDPLAPAAFAASYSIGGNGPGRLIDRYSAGGPWLGFFTYPNATSQPGKLSTGGAGYGQWSPDGGPTYTTTPGVGMELLPNGAPGLGVVPITEGQIDTSNMPPGNYVLRVVPKHAPPAYSGNNGLRGDCDLSIEQPAFAVYMNETFWDDISFTLIPEPSSLLLLALGGLAVMRRRR